MAAGLCACSRGFETAASCTGPRGRPRSLPRHTADCGTDVFVLAEHSGTAEQRHGNVRAVSRTHVAGDDVQKRYEVAVLHHVLRVTDAEMVPDAGALGGGEAPRDRANIVLFEVTEPGSIRRRDQIGDELERILRAPSAGPPLSAPLRNLPLAVARAAGKASPRLRLWIFSSGRPSRRSQRKAAPQGERFYYCFERTVSVHPEEVPSLGTVSKGVVPVCRHSRLVEFFRIGLRTSQLPL